MKRDSILTEFGINDIKMLQDPYYKVAKIDSSVPAEANQKTRIQFYSGNQQFC